MLKQFKSTDRGNLGEFIIDDYLLDGGVKSGYRVVVIATEFPGEVDPNYGRGKGSWTVDYPDTTTTFWKLTEAYSPIAVMTTSRSGPDLKWILEKGSTNKPQGEWNVSPSWNLNRPPYIGGGIGNAKFDRAPPNALLAPGPGNPPDATHVQGFQMLATDQTLALQSEIVDALKPPTFAVTELIPQKNPIIQGATPDDYVSAYTGYHSVWYSRWARRTCKAGWHTHVGSGISVDNASKAIKIQLKTLINWLDSL